MNLLDLFTRQREEWHHLIEWMKLQEAANREMAEMLVHINDRFECIEERLDELNQRTIELTLLAPHEYIPILKDDMMQRPKD